MASELKVDKFTGVSTAGSILVTGEGNSTTTNLQQGLCKAWFQDETLANNSTTTGEDSFNISGFTDVQAGYLTVSFSSNFNNTGYSDVSVNGTSSTIIPLTKYNATTSSDTILMYKVSNTSYTDCGMCATFHGDLA